MRRVAPASSTARAWPPRPAVQSTNVPPRAGTRSASTSATMTGSWIMSATPRSAPSDGEFRQHEAVGVGSLLALELRVEPVDVPHFDVIDAAEHVHLAYNGGVLAQEWRNDE